jgi:hypothetical protein
MHLSISGYENMDLPMLNRRGEANFDLFPYVPSAGAAWAFVVLFGISAVAHLVLFIMFRTWFFIPFFLGCVGKQNIQIFHAGTGWLLTDHQAKQLATTDALGRIKTFATVPRFLSR